MSLNLLYPRKRNYWDVWPQDMDWNDPIEEFLLPSMALNIPRNQRVIQRRIPSDVKNDSNKFEVKLDCSHFKPEEIEVKTIDNNIIIHGKHEEKMDKHGWVSREFTRRYTLPEECEAKQVTTSLNSNGVLTIEAPKKRLEPLKDNERVVPIKVIHMSSDDKQNEIQN